MPAIITMARFRDAALAGIAATIVWEVWARLVTPAVIGGPLEPAALIMSVFGLGAEHRPLAELLHFITGIVFYPLGYVLVMRPVRPLGWLGGGIAYGVVLWVFALFVMAGLVAGLPLFLGFIPLTWMSLIGHLIFALVLTGTLDRLERRGAYV